MRTLIQYASPDPAAPPDWTVSGDYYFNCGGPDYTDAHGRLWAALGGGGNGNAYDYGANNGVSSSPLWHYVLYGTYPPFTVPLPAGTYRLTAYLKEVYLHTPGERLNGLQVSGGPVLYQDVDGYTGDEDTDLDPPVVLTYPQPLVVGGGGLTLSLLGGNTPIVNALSFQRL